MNRNLKKKPCLILTCNCGNFTNLHHFLTDILLSFHQTRPVEQQQQAQQQAQAQHQQDGSKRNSASSQGSNNSEGMREGVDPDPEWAPHVDLGKQLATLHALLVDSLPKLPDNKIQV